jgi:hypothetical protein
MTIFQRAISQVLEKGIPGLQNGKRTIGAMSQRARERI